MNLYTTKLLIINFLLFFSISAIAQSNHEGVQVTRNAEDVKNLERIGEVTAEASQVYGGQAKLRRKATEKLKEEVLKLGGTIVLIQVDNFEMTPIIDNLKSICRNSL